jgi:hypothetical protein
VSRKTVAGQKAMIELLYGQLVQTVQQVSI